MSRLPTWAFTQSVTPDLSAIWAKLPSESMDCCKLAASPVLPPGPQLMMGIPATTAACIANSIIVGSCEGCSIANSSNPYTSHIL